MDSAAALDAVQTGPAERLIVAMIDRLSRRFRDAVDLMETAADEGWPLYIADIDADLTTSNGCLVARTVCDSFEGATTTQCPDRRLTGQERDDVYRGRLDYRHCHSTAQPSLYCPGGYHDRAWDYEEV